MSQRSIIIIAGPNGAGKTTFARNYLPKFAGIKHFVNADEIARGLSHFLPESAAIPAGRILLETLNHYAAQGESFSFETTLSGRVYLQHIRRWRAQGYHVSLVYLSLPDAKVAVNRVKMRVTQGGHSIPEATILRRFKKSLANLAEYQANVDSWHVFDNSIVPAKLIAEGRIK